MRDYCNRLQVLGLAAVLAMTAAVVLALPAAATTSTSLPSAPATAPLCIDPATHLVCATPPGAPAGGWPAAAGTPPATSTPASQPCGSDFPGGLTCSVGRIGDGILGIQNFASNPLGAVGGGLLGLVFMGSAGAIPFLNQVMTGTPDLAGGGFAKIWQLFADAALVLLGVALIFRLVKQAVSESKSGQGGAINVLLDVGPRLLIFPAMAWVSYDVLFALARVSTTIGGNIYSNFFALTATNVGDASLIGTLLHLLNLTLNPTAMAFELIGGIVIMCMLMYVVMLMAMRFVLLTFMIVVAPVAIMCGAYDTNNQMFQWWLTSTIGALLVPIIVGTIAGVTVALAAVPGLTGQGGGVIEADVFMIGGLWFMGKAIHHGTLGAFAGKNFSGMLAAAEVGMFAWTRPMNWHKSVPGVGSALGAGKAAGGAAAGGRGVGTIGDTAPAAGLLAPNTPFHNGFKREVVERGILQDEVAGYASAMGMPAQATMAEKVDAYLAVPAHAEKVYATTYAEWITTGKIDPLNSDNSDVGINNRYNSTLTPSAPAPDQPRPARPAPVVAKAKNAHLLNTLPEERRAEIEWDLKRTPTELIPTDTYT